MFFKRKWQSNEPIKQEHPLLTISNGHLRTFLNGTETNVSDVENKFYDKTCILFIRKLNSILDAETKDEIKNTFDKLPETLWIHWRVEKMYPFITKGIGQDKINNVLEMVRNDISKMNFTEEVSLLKYPSLNQTVETVKIEKVEPFVEKIETKPIIIVEKKPIEVVIEPIVKEVIIVEDNQFIPNINIEIPSFEIVDNKVETVEESKYSPDKDKTNYKNSKIYLSIMNLFSLILNFIKGIFKQNEVDFSWTSKIIDVKHSEIKPEEKINKRILTKEEKDILSNYDNIKRGILWKIKNRTDYITFVYIWISLLTMLWVMLYFVWNEKLFKFIKIMWIHF